MAGFWGFRGDQAMFQRTGSCSHFKGLFVAHHSFADMCARTFVSIIYTRFWQVEREMRGPGQDAKEMIKHSEEFKQQKRGHENFLLKDP